jgi:hypothetical protein
MVALNTHEDEFASNFIVPEKRARYRMIVDTI